MTVVRPATEADLAAMLAIYNYEVLNNTATFDTETRPIEFMRAWLEEHAHPYCGLVADDDGFIAGYASLSRYGWRAAYGNTVEDSVYIHPDRRRQGHGRLLLEAVVLHARKQGFHTVLGRITADNVASIELHRVLGFEVIGREREVGFKFGRWLDVLTMQLMLG